MNMQFCKLGQAVIEAEVEAISALSNRLDERFEQACHLLLACQGRIIVMGMGKSGHIAKKTAATLASTGSPAFFVHPAEAAHGDFGMIKPEDIIIAISYSGNAKEILTLVPLIKRQGTPLISLTGNLTSALAQASDITLDVSVKSEACPHGLAPTSSTTASLVMGDALAIALLQTKGFSADDFALSHPGGSLGRKLLLKVKDLAHCDESLPLVSHNALISEALIEVTDKKLGMTCVVDNKGLLAGVFTDGDVRRALNQNHDIHTTAVNEVMTRNSQTIKADELAASALKIMQDHAITSIVIIDEDQRPIGVTHMHDIIKAGLI